MKKRGYFLVSFSWYVYRRTIRSERLSESFRELLPFCYPLRKLTSGRFWSDEKMFLLASIRSHKQALPVRIN